MKKTKLEPCVEQITAQVTKLRQRDTAYQTQYGMDYPTFCQRIAQDATFVHQIETSVSKTWEIDLADWEFCFKGIADWSQQL